MGSLSITPNLTDPLITTALDSSMTEHNQFKPVQNTVSFDSKESRTYNAAKPYGFQQRKLESSSETVSRRSSDQSLPESLDSHFKLKKTIILSFNPTTESGKSTSTQASSYASPKEELQATELPKTVQPEELLSIYPDLEYDNKIFKFHDWKIFSRLVSVSSLPGVPAGIFVHSEDEYFWYFRKPVVQPTATVVKKESQKNDDDAIKPEINKEELLEELDSELIAPEDKKSAKLLEDVKHSFKYRQVNKETTSLAVNPSQDVLEALKKLVEHRAMSHMKEKDVKVSYSCVKSNFTKNLPKKIGDQFADYLKKHSHIDMSKALKDKMSWKVLNAYLDDENPSKENTIGAKALIQLFIDFILTYDMNKIDESRTKDDVSKTCYKLAIMNLKAAFEELNRSVDCTKIVSLSVVKSWPSLDIHFKANVKVKCLA